MSFGLLRNILFVCFLKPERVHRPKRQLCFQNSLWCKHAVIQLFINSLCGLLPLTTLKCPPRFRQPESVHKQCPIYINAVPEENFMDKRKNLTLLILRPTYHRVMLQRHLYKRTLENLCHFSVLQSSTWCIWQTRQSANLPL